MKCPLCQRGEATFSLFGISVCKRCSDVFLEYRPPETWISRRHYENGTSEAVAELHALIREVEQGERTDG